MNIEMKDIDIPFFLDFGSKFNTFFVCWMNLDSCSLDTYVLYCAYKYTVKNEIDISTARYTAFR